MNKRIAKKIVSKTFNRDGSLNRTPSCYYTNDQIKRALRKIGK